MVKVKPILRYAGSKSNMIKYLLPHFEGSKNFIDVFGGSGIVGVNVKSNLNIPVTINDFDNILPPTDRQIVDNMLKYDGYGTISLECGKYFARRVKNGFWNKVDIYRKILDKINITHVDYKDIPIFTDGTYYLDPPYFEGTNLYQNKINHKEFLEFVNDLSTKVNKVIISYSKNDDVMEWYKEWKIIEIERNNTSGRGKKRAKRIELLLIKGEQDDTKTI